MNVASLELCKELFELSGWDGTYLTMRYGERLYGWTQTWLLNKNQLSDGAHGKHITETDIPAYDLGYLLRKLPQGINIRKDANKYWVRSAGGEWKPHASPEDAAAKLAIELFNQGILTKGGEEK